MIKVASSLLDTATKWLEDNPTAATGLLTGGLGALGGFALTGSDPDESTGDTLKRRLRNALIVGGLAGGAGALGSAALSNFSTSHEAPLPPPVPTKATKARKIGLDILGAGLGAYGGYALGEGISNSKLPLLGQGKKILGIAGNLGLDNNHGAGVALEALKDHLTSNASDLDKINAAVGGLNGKHLASALNAIGISKLPGGSRLSDFLANNSGWLTLRNATKGVSTILGGIAGGVGAHKLQDAFLDK